MTQGRKSRTALAIGCVLAALSLAALAPAFAGAQTAAQNEYDYNDQVGGQGTGGQTPGTGGSSSDSGGSGGAPILIGLAAVAAVCAGAAVWRLRERTGGGPPKVGPGAPETAGETQ